MNPADDRDYDTQPERDMPASRLLSLSTGLVLGCGLILGALLGALVGHFALDTTLAGGHPILVGAVSGAIVVAILGVAAVRAMSSRLAGRRG